MMNKTTAIVAVAALAALAMAPTAQADLTTRSFLDEALHTDFGAGWGLYDTTGPTYCTAVLGFVTWAGVGVFYYPGARYWNTAVSADLPVPATSLGPEPTDCLGILPPPVPNDTLNVGPAHVDVGGAFHMDDVLGDNQVANLAKTFVDVQYCTGSPAVAVGDAGIAVEDLSSNVIVGAFTAKDVVCGNAGGDSLYPAACGLFSLTTSLGSLASDAPIMLADSTCNSLQGSPGGLGGVDYVFERCVDSELFDVGTGVVGVEYDTDFATVAADTSMAGWAYQLLGVLPTGLFPNVSNLEQNNVDCNGAAYGNA